MKRNRQMLLGQLILAVGLSAAAPLPAAGVQCPGSGAQAQITVNNPTSNVVSGVTLSGKVGGQAYITCSGASMTYTRTVTLNPGPNTFTVPTTGGLVTGYWIHKITAGSGQVQYQKGPVLYGGPPVPTPTPGRNAAVAFTYFPNVVTVNTGGDGGGTCPATCTFRSAITAANNIPLGNPPVPVLIQFSSSLPNPTTIGTGAGILYMSRGYVTIDGTDVSGNPYIVGDQNAATAGYQDPFPRTIDLNNVTRFVISSASNTFKGLFIKNTTDGTQAYHLFNGGTDTTFNAVKLDGGNSECSPFTGCDSPGSLFASGTGDGSNVNVTMNNVEAASAEEAAVLLDEHAIGVINDSWLHNSGSSNAYMSPESYLDTKNSTIEQAGFNTAGFEYPNSAHGITVSGDFAIFDSTANVIRSNSADGVHATGLSTLSPQRDYVCGNNGDGLYTASGPYGPPSVNGRGGLGFVYNGEGVSVVSTDMSIVSLNDDCVFTSNDACGIENRGTNGNVFAQGDQWRDASDVCNAGPVDTSNPASAPDELMSLETVPTYPTGVIRMGQTVRVLGRGFNGIKGNPVAPAGVSCTTGFGGYGALPSCCNVATKSNVCTGTHTPPPYANVNSGNCVELMGTSGNWEQVSVSSITPKLLVAQIPDSTFGCVGGYGEQVYVTKRRSDNSVASIWGQYCTNQAQP